MRELDIMLINGQSYAEKVIAIDGKPVKFQNNQYGGLFYRYQTESDKVNIKVYRVLDVGGIFWFITQIFFFLISIFGIFDIRRKERCMVIDFELEVYLRDDNKITLQFDTPRENNRAVLVQTNLPGRIISNQYCVDIKAKNTLKALKLTKIILTVAIIITAIAVLLTKL